MRPLFPIVALLAGGTLFTACSKKADTAPGASSSPDQATTETVGVPPAGGNSEITFSLSGNKDGTTGGAAGSSAAAEGTYIEARQINDIYPFYPLSLRMRAIEGRVDIGVHINTEGRVESTEVLNSTEERFTPYALAAVRTARFIPAMDNGKPVPTQGRMSVPFVSELGSGKLTPDSILGRIAYLDGIYYTKDVNGKMVPAETKEPLRFSIITPFPGNAKPGEELKARVRVSITEEGQVTSVSVSDASSPEFAAALKEVALFWQFIPRMKAGKPVASSAIEFPLVAKVPGAAQP
jgi:TonB family protein